MSDITVPGFASSTVFSTIKSTFDSLPEDKKKQLLKQVNGVFQFDVKNNEGKTETWTADMKKAGTVVRGKLDGVKPDITIQTDDKTFVEIGSGRLNGQKAFMSGKLKVKGQIMMATKLDTVLKQTRDINPLANKGVAAQAASAQTDNIREEGFASSDVFQQIADGLKSAPAAEKKAQMSKAKGIFQFDIKSGQKSQTWTLDLKNDGSLVKGTIAGKKPDIVISVSDSDFVDMATGKLNGQKAFMAGKLKIKGQIMLATKLNDVLKSAQAKL
ncbi:uncharacterized protein VTP21DRAFT_4084 [Calcarisporiella thermophila]|uniref:uncharacterized protein n=1 Tax=Calcarisporiella thermophila TaxID=911321 RepID=UPI0037425BA6